MGRTYLEDRNGAVARCGLMDQRNVLSVQIVLRQSLSGVVDSNAQENLRDLRRSHGASALSDLAGLSGMVDPNARGNLHDLRRSHGALALSDLTGLSGVVDLSAARGAVELH